MAPTTPKNPCLDCGTKPRHGKLAVCIKCAVKSGLWVACEQCGKLYERPKKGRTPKLCETCIRKGYGQRSVHVIGGGLPGLGRRH
jgi:hypothetical protein